MGNWSRLGLCIVVAAALGAAFLGTPAQAKKPKTEKNEPAQGPELLLEGGRKLAFVRTFQNDRDVSPKRSFFRKVLDVVAGAPDRRQTIRPYGIAVDSRGRAIVTDPGAMGVHIFDFVDHKYKFISRNDKEENSMTSPQCVAVDAQDNFYVTDSDTGRIFVFEPGGKFKRIIGNLKGGEGYFKRPTGIAVDSAAQRIYVTDTLRNKIYVLDMNGSVMQMIGKTGTEHGEFNYPTEIVLHGQDLAVVDAMNFRVQVFDRGGNFKYAVGGVGDEDDSGSFFRPKGISFDSEGHLYVVDAAWDRVQVFDQQGQLLYYFGSRGVDPWMFNLPSGMFIDHNDGVYIVDSYNNQVEVFQYYGKREQGGGQ
ncbi:MAG: 6-bladed beta-propeller [Terriglobales bacterium]